MFRFVFAWTPADTWDAAMTAEGFVGVECDGEPPAGVPLVGRRSKATLEISRQGGRIAIRLPTPFPSDGDYVVVPPFEHRLADRLAGDMLCHALANQAPHQMLLFENGGAFRTATDLWELMEAVRVPTARIALDINYASEVGGSAAVLVPTLNLRIGLIRVREKNDELTAYARRLAGIGFEGWVVLDPPTGNDRLTAARELAAVFRSIFPGKPAKKAVPAKAAG